MRRSLRLLPLVLVSLTLAACGGDDETDAGAAAAGSATTAAAAPPDAGAFPVTLRHARGSTTVEREPRRIVTVGLRDQDALLALGIKAVGAMDWFQQDTFAKWPWEDWGGQAPRIVSTGGFEINFERVAALRPDLILGVYQDLSAADYAKLSKIAPTVAQSARHKAYTTPWREETRAIAEAVGRRTEGEKLIADVDAKFAAAREAHPEYAKEEAMIIDPDGGNFFAFSSTDPRGRFLEELGFDSSKRVDAIAEGEFGTELSEERLDVRDVDRLFVLSDAKSRARIFANPAFRALDVVKRGDVVEIPYYDRPQTGAAIAFNSVHSLPYAIDGTLRILEAQASR